jgi:hypothetical protein
MATKTKITLAQFCDQSYLDAKLIRSVVRQRGGWESFTESAEDITRHGASGGFGGFIYYRETEPFAARNMSLILAAAKDMAEQFGDEDEYQLIAGFNCLKPDYTVGMVAAAIHDRKSGDRTMVLNALAWFALEEVARSYCDVIDS